MSEDGEETPKPLVKRKAGRPTFERPPYAKEIFTEETKKIFDNLPGKYRHFVKQLVQTGNPAQAAKLSGIRSLAPDGEDKQADVADLLKKSGLGPLDLVEYLIECVRAEVVLRDKHGNIHNTVDINTRLKAIEFCFRLNGTFNPKKAEKADTLLELFAATDPESKE